MITLRYLICLSVGSLLLAAATVVVAQQNYPLRPVRILVGFPAGGPPDIVARLLAQKFSERFGRQFVVENRSGASGMIAADAVAKAAPDGHTLLVSDTGALVISPQVEKAPYDTARDFAAVSIAATMYHVLTVHPSIPARSVKELIALAKAQPGAINFASAGTGGNIFLIAEMFQMATRTKMTHVPYKGSALAMVDLLSGEVQLIFAGIMSVLPYLPKHRLVALAVTSPTRSSLLPEIPTLAESGVSGVELAVWFALMAPAATPRDIITRVNAEIVKLATTPDYRQQLEQQAMGPVSSNPDQFSAFLKVEQDKWGRAIKAAGIKPN